MSVLLCQGTALALPLRDASVHCVVTSPPYLGLRDYGTGTWQGGEAGCEHREADRRNQRPRGAFHGGNDLAQTHVYMATCGRCGATRVDAQLGLEASVEEYVAAMVQVFREVKRVLHPTGVLFINMGDSYQDKQLQGIPWRLAFALQADSWVLRSDIIWDKPSCMPESVQDRPTRSHEYVFLFSKQARYFYDAEAVREEASYGRSAQGNGLYARARQADPRDARQTPPVSNLSGDPSTGRNLRSVWRIPSEPFSGSHFATFPPALVRRCLLAGAPTQVCSACSAPYARVTDRTFRPMTDRSPEKLARASGIKGIDSSRHDATTPRGYTDVATLGFTPTCPCFYGPGYAAPETATVLDPFCGSGTTLLVARELGHHAVGIDLSSPYLHDIARQRLGLAALARWQGQDGHATPAHVYDDLPLFAAGGG